MAPLQIELMMAVVHVPWLELSETPWKPGAPLHV
jgi:hypothetical protein